MTTIHSFRELLVWQKSMDLAERCYRLSRRFSGQDQQVLGYQLRKTSVSIPSNIAEGHASHLWTAHGSSAELETQLELGRRVEIVTVEEAEALIADAQEVGRMLHGLVRSLQRPPDAALTPDP